MLRLLLAPRWLALHALVVVSVTACAVLGLWQWRAFSAESVVRPVAGSPPEPLAQVLAAGRPLDATTAGRRVSATGSYDPDEQLLVPGRRLGGRTGLHVLTPLRTPGGVLPVRRGWVASADDPATAVPAGTVTVTGVLHPPEGGGDDASRGALLPAGQVPVIDATELHIAYPYAPSEVYAGFLELTTQDPPGTAAPAAVRSEPRFASGGLGRWQNLSYVGQWWIFGLAAVGFWVAFVRAGLRRRQDELEDLALAGRVDPTRPAPPPRPAPADAG